MEFRHEEPYHDFLRAQIRAEAHAEANPEKAPETTESVLEIVMLAPGALSYAH